MLANKKTHKAKLLDKGHRKSPSTKFNMPKTLDHSAIKGASVHQSVNRNEDSIIHDIETLREMEDEKIFKEDSRDLFGPHASLPEIKRSHMPDLPE